MNPRSTQKMELRSRLQIQVQEHTDFFSTIRAQLTGLKFRIPM